MRNPVSTSDQTLSFLPDYKGTKSLVIMNFRNKTTQTEQSQPGHKQSQISSPRHPTQVDTPVLLLPYCHPRLPAAHPAPPPHPGDAEAIQANQVVATTCLQDPLDPPTAHSSAQGPGPWHTGRMDLAQTQALPKRRKVTNSQAD